MALHLISIPIHAPHPLPPIQVPLNLADQFLTNRELSQPLVPIQDPSISLEPRLPSSRSSLRIRIRVGIRIILNLGDHFSSRFGIDTLPKL
jgi:hypothetical protein